MRTRQELPAFILYESEYEEIPKSGIEVKAVSDECLAKKCSSYMGQRGISLIMILPDNPVNIE